MIEIRMYCDGPDCGQESSLRDDGDLPLGWLTVMWAESLDITTDRCDTTTLHFCGRSCLRDWTEKGGTG